MITRACSLAALAITRIVLPVSPAAAQSSSPEDFRAIISAQAQRIDAQAQTIEALSARIDAIEGHKVEVAASAPVTAARQMASNSTDTPTSDTKPSASSGNAAAASNKAGAVLADWHAGGPTFSGPDGRFTFHPRGRVLADVSTTSGSRYGDRNVAGTEFRNVRLGGEGGIGDFVYKMEADFAGNSVALRDAFIGWETKLAERDAGVYLGNKLNDRSIDGATSITAIPFAERNSVANVVVPQVGIYGLGLFASIVGDNGHVSVNIKGEDAGSNNGTRDDSLIYMARAHFVPLRRDDSFVHLGIWGFHERLNRSVDRLTQGDIEGSDFNQSLNVEPGTILDPRSDNGFGVEGGGVWHSLWALGEYGERHIRVTAAPTITQTAWSIGGGWFPTGEKAPFSSRTGAWGRPHVRRSVTDGGIGAFELLARYDETDLTDAPLGGRGHNLTLGGNWYLNNWADLKLNWIRYTIQNPAGDFPGRDAGSTLILRGEVSF